MNNLMLEKWRADITVASEKKTGGLGHLTSAMQRLVQVLQQNPAAKEQGNYFFKARSKL
ncbi:hypothetical protein [Colwellia sp. MB3u-4]|uniref:hypothetical protein n=1 Tax=Colwellia sp. MB3u-4 TaxID=2759822 RepID=UPI0015F60C35|nr:hypothetical protein [Colwellia sp. MB3u-4]MBA6290294.1 hypothetical protein [Colwellia sp. MB3u-4]